MIILSETNFNFATRFINVVSFCNYYQRIELQISKRASKRIIHTRIHILNTSWKKNIRNREMWNAKRREGKMKRIEDLPLTWKQERTGAWIGTSEKYIHRWIRIRERIDRGESATSARGMHRDALFHRSLFTALSPQTENAQWRIRRGAS